MILVDPFQWRILFDPLSNMKHCQDMGFSSAVLKLLNYIKQQTEGKELDNKAV